MFFKKPCHCFSFISQELEDPTQSPEQMSALYISANHGYIETFLSVAVHVCLFFSLSFPFFLFGQGYASALFRFEHHSVSVRKSSRFGLEYLNFDRHKRCWRCPDLPTKNIQRSNVQMVKRQRPMSEIPSGFALTNDT